MKRKTENQKKKKIVGYHESALLGLYYNFTTLARSYSHKMRSIPARTVQLKLDEQVKAIDEFLEGEESRVGIVPDKLDCGHDRKARTQPPATNDRQVSMET